MKLFRNTMQAILVILTIFLALTAIPGGISLVVNFYAPPVEQLPGSIFNDRDKLIHPDSPKLPLQ